MVGRVCPTRWTRFTHWSSTAAHAGCSSKNTLTAFTRVKPLFARPTGASRKLTRESGAVNGATPFGKRAASRPLRRSAAPTTSKTSSKFEKTTCVSAAR